MPTFSEFKSYKITINNVEHDPPHIHLMKGRTTIARISFDEKGNVCILSKEEGFKRSEFKALKQWMIKNKDKLLENWYRAKDNKELLIIEGVK